MFIYKIINQIDGKIYIGQTIKTVQYRWKKHLIEAQSNRHGCKYLNSAIRKYGEKNFKVETLLQVGSREWLDYYETKFIEQFESTNPAIGYNICRGGQGNPNPNRKPLSEETKRKIGLGNRGKTRSQEVRKAISRSLAGRTSSLSPAGRKAIQEKMTGKNNPMFGKKVSAETRLKQSQTHTGKIRSSASCKKQSETMKGHLVSQETRDKIRVAKMGHKFHGNQYTQKENSH